MNNTYEEYVGFLNENRGRIRDSLLIGRDSSLRDFYLDGFLSNYRERGERPFNPGLISATDSSEFVRELYNGKKIFLIRAFAKSRDRVEQDFICDVADVNRDEIRNFTILLMEHTEHVATLKLLEHEKPDFVLMDGSLAGRLMHKRNRIDADSYEDFMETYFSKLYELLARCIELGIPALFIAKSSESTVFRRYLLSKQAEASGETDAIRSERGIKRTDHLLVKSFAPGTGYTQPLRVAYDAAKSPFRGSRISVVTTHALPDYNDLPVKIDMVLPEAQDNPPGKSEPYEPAESIMDMIFWGYGGLKTHNIWLADVDREVKFRQKEVEQLYMRTFERVIGVPFYETRGERRARIRI